VAEVDHGLWSQVLRPLSVSIYGEQVFCSITTEMKWLPGFRDNAELTALHRENYETSYHRNTAAGNLTRLAWQEAQGRDPSKRLVLMTVECLLEAREHDRRTAQHLRALEEQAGAYRSWLEAASRWHEHRTRWLRRAVRTLRGGIPAGWWEEGTQLIEQPAW
jgi:hypothetical protein